jgi:aminopeptidase N
MDEEVQFPSLIFGKFQGEEFRYTSEITGAEVVIRVYAVPQGTIGGISYAGVKRSRPVAEEAMQILKLFETLYGPYPYDYLNVAQMAIGMGFGQAPPGLVQLTGEAFMSTAALAAIEVRADFFHEFFAHEIAHQWWAHVVWGTSFRDAWLSESFAEYSAGLYWQQYAGQDGFQNKLKEWRQNAMMAEGSAPIAALSTLSGDMAGQYYVQQIYNKGPYVVHMLRMLVGHDKWVEGMQSFFKKYRHTNLTTEKLVAEMERVAGYDLYFFFDQWWKGATLPRFEFTYDVQPLEDGRYLFTGTITQPAGQAVKVVMPVFFHFGGQEVSIQNRPVLTSPDVYKAYLPKAPRRVTLDDFHTILGEIVQRGSGDSDAKEKGKGKKGS